jgi:serine/threonine protein kinase
VKLDPRLAGLAREAPQTVNVEQTINMATLAMASKAAAQSPPSVARLPVLDLSDGDSELSVVRILGTGGMGHVQLAHQRALNRDVAIKRVAPNSKSPLAAASILHEARVTGRLEHPNIVPVHMLGRDRDGLPIIVMKRVEGVRWRDNIVTNTAPAEQRHLEVLLEVCNAVQFAHSMGIVHRDIKPSNVMVGMFGEVYLLDWGIAVAAGTPAFEHTADGEPSLPLGTPAFMAPEMVDLDGVIDIRTDVYQLGASLHQALVGTARHAKHRDLVGVLKSVLDSEPYNYPPDVPEGLAATCNMAMHKDPGRRYQDVGEFRDALSRFISHRSSLRLGSEADSRLHLLLNNIASLRGAHDDNKLAAIHKLFTECHFAFKQALSEWYENPAAHEGMQKAIEAMAEFELTRGNIGAAQLLVDELAEPSSELKRSLEHARTEAETNKSDLAGLQEMRDDLDVSVSQRARYTMTVLLSITAAALGALFLPILGTPILQRSNWTILVAFAVFGLACAITLFVGRNKLLSNTANRRIAAALAIGVAGMMGQRTLAALNGIDMKSAAAADLAACAAVALLASFTIDRGIAVMAAAYTVGVFTVQVLPPGRGTTIGFVGTQAVALCCAAVYWRMRKKDDGAQQ